MKKPEHIIILGAGLVGSLLAVYLLKRGYRITLYERRPDMRKVQIPAGRSINLALSDRGWRALEGVNLDNHIRQIGIPMKGRMIHPLQGENYFQPYGKEGQAIYAVSRGILNCTLLDLAEQAGATIVFNQRCTTVDLVHNTAKFQHSETHQTSEATADLIFGADGAYSAARLQLQLTDRYNYSQSYLEHGYKELMFVAGADGRHQLEKNALHIWPRGGYMLIALPNLDGTFTVTLFFPFKGNPSFEMLDSKRKVKSFFAEVFPDTLSLLPALEEDFLQNPTGSLVTVKSFPWSFENKLVLIGDAAHAIVPFYGQGMNCGFEDCTVLNQLLDKYSDDWGKVIPAYEQLRKPAADGIAELAVNNFIEMRDLVGHPDFILRKKIEAWFSEKHPDQWIPLYSMVTFSHIPYHEALQRGRQQDAIMNEVMNMPEIEKNWQSPSVEKLILSRLSNSSG
jgi:kynurenine 3-monooxygenase